MTALKQFLKMYSPILLAEEEDQENAIKGVIKWLQQYRHSTAEELLEKLKKGEK